MLRPVMECCSFWAPKINRRAGDARRNEFSHDPFLGGLYFGCLSRCPVRKVPILGISRTHCLPRIGIRHTCLALTFEERNETKQIVLAILQPL